MTEVNNCETAEQNGFQVVQVQGEVDLSWSQKLRRAVLDALAKGQPVAIDLSQVTYIDSSGIAALVEGFQSARGKSQHFSLVAVSQPVIAVLELARLDRVFPIFPTLDEAAQS